MSRYKTCTPHELLNLEGRLFKVKGHKEVMTSSQGIPWFYNNKKEFQCLRLHSIGFVWRHKPLKIKIVSKGSRKMMMCKVWDEEGIAMYGILPEGIVTEEKTLSELLKQFGS